MKIAIVGNDLTEGFGGVAKMAHLLNDGLNTVKGIHSEIIDETKLNKENINQFDHIHLVVIGSYKSRILNSVPSYAPLILKSFKGVLSIDLRTPWDFVWYEKALPIFKYERISFINTFPLLKDYYLGELKKRFKKSYTIKCIEDWITEKPKKIPKNENKIVHLSRITYSKRVHEFVLLSELLNKETYYAGAIGSVQYFDTFKNCGKAKYLGSFDSPFDVIKDAQYVADFTRYPNDGKRLQLTIMEAMANESVPILHSQWTSDFFKDFKNGIVFDFYYEVKDRLEAITEKDIKEIIKNNNVLIENRFNGKNSVKEYSSLIKEAKI